MALQTEIWINDIVGNLFADNTFASRSRDFSAFVNNKTVHVPNAGAAPTVVKNRTTTPGTVGTRIDADLEFVIDEYTTDPIRIGNAEQVELSYDKRQSVLGAMQSALAEQTNADLLSAWVTASKAKSAIKSVAAFDRKTITDIKVLFDGQDIPQEGRCIALAPLAYGSLLNSLSDAESVALAQTLNAAAGSVGRLYGFDLYVRSTIATGCDAFAWHADSVCRAVGAVDIYQNENDPTYYGDVMSALVRAGGAMARLDGKGTQGYKLTAG